VSAPTTAPPAATTLDLLNALHRPGEHVSICHRDDTGAFRSQILPAGYDAIQAIAEHMTGDVWHGVNPVRPGIQGRGTAADVTRLAALWIDLDVKAGAMGGNVAAGDVIADLSTMLGTPPAFIVHTGHGLHPYWPLDDDALQLTSDERRADAVALLTRWRRLVTRVATAHHGDVDNVFDLPRVLRTPGTRNRKEGGDLPVVVEARGGYALDVAVIRETFAAYGIDEWPEDREQLGQIVTPRRDWPSAESTCTYTRAMVSAWTTDTPTGGRHYWALSQLVRLACARRLGCITDTDLNDAYAVLQGRLDQLRAPDGLRPREVADTVKDAVDRAERKTDAQVRAELGDHLRERAASVSELAAATHRGQLRMAYRLARGYEGRLLHVHGIGWHRWDGRRWAEDDTGEAFRAVYDTVREALADSLNDKTLREDARRCESASGVAGVLQLAGKLETFAATAQDLDPDPYLLNVANGTLDLRTTADRITKVTAAAYDPGANPAAWNRFLDRVLPDPEVRRFLQRYTGLGLAGTVLEHVLAIATGTGRNGKSVFVNTVMAALGDYAASAEPDLFMHRDGAHPTGEMDLRGVRWVVVSESEKGRRLAEATVKRLTGGDRIKARRMRQDFVEFPASHTPVLVTNYLPTVSGDDAALWARLRVIPFDVVIPEAERDPRLTERLALSVDAVLTWAVAGWQQYQAGGLADPDAVSRATNAYHANSDAVGRFVDDCCITGPNFRTSAAEMFERWARWCVDDGSEPCSKRAFGEALDQRGFRSVKGTNGTRMRNGIALTVEDGQDKSW